MKTSLAIRGLAVLLLAGGIATVGLKQSALARLRTEHQALLADSQEAQQLAVQNREIPRLRADVEAAEKMSLDNEELLRLRSQVGELRRQAADLEKLRAENQRLQEKAQAGQSARSATPDLPPDYITREALHDAGTTTPEDTVQTVLWAMTQGKLERMMQCSVTAQNQPESKADLDSQAVEIAQQFSAFPGFRIADKTNLAPDEVRLDIESTPGGVPLPMKVKYVDGQWKLDAR